MQHKAMHTYGSVTIGKWYSTLLPNGLVACLVNERTNERTNARSLLSSTRPVVDLRPRAVFMVCEPITNDSHVHQADTVGKWFLLVNATNVAGLWKWYSPSPDTLRIEFKTFCLYLSSMTVLIKVLTINEDLQMRKRARERERSVETDIFFFLCLFVLTKLWFFMCNWQTLLHNQRVYPNAGSN